MKVSIGARSDTGRVRDANEDSYLVAEPLFVVADGMGGHIAGDVASQTAVEVITNLSKERGPQEDGALESYVVEANAAIHRKAGEDPQLSGMGTTCTLLFLDGSTAHFAHVGDSRAYLLHDGSLRQVTEDHTLVERMVKEGRINRDEAARHPQRSIITRALGVDQNVEVDTFDIEVANGDRILLCSDGLTSMVDEGIVGDLLQKVADPQDAADRLVDAANLAGGEDNITVVIVDIGKEPGAPPPPPAPREDTSPGYDPDEEDDTGGRSWLRRIVITLLVLAILGGGAFFATRWALGNSYFVGATEDGRVAIFTGIPEEVVGFSFRDEEEVTELSLEDLPTSLRANVEEGIKVDSIADAEATIANLQDRAEELAPEPEPSPSGKAKKGSN